MISIYSCSKYGHVFENLIQSITKTASSQEYEILVKVDTVNDKKHRTDLLEKYNIPSYHVIFNNVTGYQNLHIMINQLASISKGTLLWGIGDDCIIKEGDWHAAFTAVEKQNPDNIFIINTRPECNNACCVCPVVSRGWYTTLGYLALCPTNDIFLRWAGKNSGREIQLPNPYRNLRIEHQQVGLGMKKSIRGPALKLAKRRAPKEAKKIRQAFAMYQSK